MRGIVMRLIVVLLAVLAASGCAVNPVTGKNELSIYDESWDLQTGEQYYAPLRQQQGGDFVLDPELVEYVREVGDRVAAE
ncbi:MAG: peptidase M48, partial [Pseudomonadota bacterium]